MKTKARYLFQGLVVLLFIGAFTCCKSKKEITEAPVDERFVEVYCSGPEYATNNEFIRASNAAESIDQSNSKRMAISNARAELAGSISTLVSGVVDNYFQQETIEAESEFMQLYEGLYREVVNERLAGTRIICERIIMTPEGRYKTYVAIEMASAEILEEANKRISDDERFRLHYNYERFKQTFEEEMERIRSEQKF